MRARVLTSGLLVLLIGAPVAAQSASFMPSSIAATRVRSSGIFGADRIVFRDTASQTFVPHGRVFTPKSRVTAGPRHAHGDAVGRVVKALLVGSIGYAAARAWWLPPVSFVCTEGASCRAANVAVTALGAATLTWTLSGK